MWKDRFLILCKGILMFIPFAAAAIAFISFFTIGFSRGVENPCLAEKNIGIALWVVSVSCIILLLTSLLIRMYPKRGLSFV